MLKIRLARFGKKKQPTYRVVVAEARSPRDGRYVEIVGHYNPRTDPATFVVDEQKVRDWLTKGAQPTERIHKLLAREGILPPPAVPSTPKKAAPAAQREAAAPATAAPAATAVAERESEDVTEDVEATSDTEEAEAGGEEEA